MIIFIDILSDKDVGSDSYEEVKKCDGAIIGLVSKKITLSEDEVDIGGNPSKEGGDEDEGVDSGENKTVINIVHTHSLVKMDFSAKDAKAALKSYWKSLLAHYTKQKNTILFDDEDYKTPKDKDKAKAAQTDAEKKLGKDKKSEYKAITAKVKQFKDNFKKLEAFVKDEILANFDEYEFYIGNEAELGNCLIIPARYEGEALSPTFYYWVDGITQKKE